MRGKRKPVKADVVDLVRNFGAPGCSYPMNTLWPNSTIWPIHIVILNLWSLPRRQITQNDCAVPPNLDDVTASKHCHRGVNFEEMFTQAQKKEKAPKAREYRAKRKAKALVLKKTGNLKWENVGGAQKVCMRVHQYDWDELKRILQLGTCPTARGSFIPTARIASHMTLSVITKVSLMNWITWYSILIEYSLCNVTIECDTSYPQIYPL